MAQTVAPVPKEQLYVQQGITASHPLPTDIAAVYDWNSLLEPVIGFEETGTLAWELDSYVVPACTPVCLDQQELAPAPSARCAKQEANRLAQRKSRQKKQVSCEVFNTQRSSACRGYLVLDQRRNEKRRHNTSLPVSQRSSRN